jgi:hypothetical protein
LCCTAQALSPLHAKSNGLFATATIALQLSLFVWSGAAGAQQQVYGRPPPPSTVQYHYLLSALFAMSVFVYTGKVMFPINDRILGQRTSLFCWGCRAHRTLW